MTGVLEKRKVETKKKTYKTKFKPMLKVYRVNSDIFDEILATFPETVEMTDNIRQYYWGSQTRKTYLSLDKNTMVVRERFFNFVMKESNHGIPSWKSVRLIRVSEKTDITIEKDINGLVAYNWVINLLKKEAGYTKEEIDACLMAHQADYSEVLKQQHFLKMLPSQDKVYKFDNCVAYDINGAHNAALCDIFPKAAAIIEKYYNMRHEHPEIKKYFNYFVGMLGSKCHKKYRGTYYWIVQRTTRKLTQRILEVGGKALYINTDGFVVQNPDKVIPSSKKLDEFKIEYQGTVYMYHCTHYNLMQTNKIKGTMPLEVREAIKPDLSKGRVGSFDRVKINVDTPDFKTSYYEYQNIKVENVEVKQL